MCLALQESTLQNVPNAPLKLCVPHITSTLLIVKSCPSSRSYVQFCESLVLLFMLSSFSYHVQQFLVVLSASQIASQDLHTLTMIIGQGTYLYAYIQLYPKVSLGSSVATFYLQKQTQMLICIPGLWRIFATWLLLITTSQNHLCSCYVSSCRSTTILSILWRTPTDVAFNKL